MRCKTNLCNLRLVLDGVRFVYLAIAIVVVCKGIYNGYKKMIEEDLSYRQEVQINDAMRYPSVSFCYKYNHGTKNVIDNYFPKFFEVAKNDGNSEIRQNILRPFDLRKFVLHTFIL